MIEQIEMEIKKNKKIVKITKVITINLEGDMNV